MANFPTVNEDENMEAEPGTTVPGDVDDLDAIEETRKAMRRIDEQEGVATALGKVEDFQKEGPGAFALDPRLRREVHKLHRQLGHPSQEIFIRALRHAGVRDDIAAWARDHYQCPICATRPKPSPARPGHLMRALEFNQVVGIDLIFPELWNSTYIILNMLCWGTNFQQAHVCKDKFGEEILTVFMNEWIKHYGPPTLLIMDRGKEFYNNQLQETVGSLGVGLHYTDPQSPWQNSRTERAGGIFKEKLQATIAETSARPEELHLVIAEVIQARNRFMDRFGFSPMQRVFGKNLRLPASLLASDTLDRELVEASASDPIKRQWEIRETAAREWLRRQDNDAVRRSLRAKTRQADTTVIPQGSWVYAFRDSPSYKGWTGPGVLISMDTNNRSAWVSMRGRLWKVSREQLRRATPEEELGAELVVELSKEMLEKVHQPGQIVYQDITAENPPDTEEFPSDEVSRVLRIEGQPNRQGAQALQESETTEESSRTESTGGPTEMELDEINETPSGPSTAAPSRQESALPHQEPDQGRLQAIPEDSAPENPTATAMRTPRHEERTAPYHMGWDPRADRRGVPSTPPVGWRPTPPYIPSNMLLHHSHDRRTRRSTWR